MKIENKKSRHAFIFQNLSDTGVETQSHDQEALQETPQEDSAQNFAERVERQSLRENIEGRMVDNPEEAILTRTREATEQAVGQIRRVERARRALNVGKWVLGGIATYAGLRILRSITRSGKEAKEGISKKRSITVGRVLGLILGGGTAALIYEKVRGRISLSDFAERWGAGGRKGIMGIATLILEKSKDGTINMGKDLWGWVSGVLGLESGEDGQDRRGRRARRSGERERRQREYEERYGEMVPLSENLGEGYNHAKSKIENGIINPTQNFIEQNKRLLMATGLMAASFRPVRNAFINTGRCFISTTLSLSKFLLSVPLGVGSTAINHPLKSAAATMAVVGILYKINPDPRKINVPKDPQKFRKFIRDKIKEESGVDTEITEKQIEEAIELIQDKNKLDELMGKINIGGTLNGMLDYIVIQEEELPLRRNLEGIGVLNRRVRIRMESAINAEKYNEDHRDLIKENYESFLSKLTEIEGEMNKGHPFSEEQKQNIEKALSELTELGREINVIIKIKGDYVYFGIMEGEEGEEVVPYQFMVNPALENNKQIKAAKEMLGVSSSADFILRNVSEDARRTFGNVIEKVRSGEGNIVVNGGVAIFTAINEKYVLGPLNVWYEAIKSLLGPADEFKITNVGVAWADGIATVGILTIGQQIVTGNLIRNLRQGGAIFGLPWATANIIWKTAAYPLNAVILPSRALWRGYHEPGGIMREIRRSSTMTSYEATKYWLHKKTTFTREIENLINKVGPNNGQVHTGQMKVAARNIQTYNGILHQLNEAKNKTTEGGRWKAWREALTPIHHGNTRMEKLYENIKNAEGLKREELEGLIKKVEEEIDKEKRIFRNQSIIATKRAQVGLMRKARTELAKGNRRKARKMLVQAERIGEGFYSRWRGALEDSVTGIFTKGQLTRGGALTSAGLRRVGGRANLGSGDALTVEGVDRRIQRVESDIARMGTGGGLEIPNRILRRADSVNIERAQRIQEVRDNMISRYEGDRRALITGGIGKNRRQIRQLDEVFIRRSTTFMREQAQILEHLELLRRKQIRNGVPKKNRVRIPDNIRMDAHEVAALKRGGHIARSANIPLNPVSRGKQVAMGTIRGAGRMALIIGIMWGAQRLIFNNGTPIDEEEMERILSEADEEDKENEQST